MVRGKYVNGVMEYNKIILLIILSWYGFVTECL